MSLRAHILVMVVTAATLGFILRMVRQHRLRAKYSVLWVSLGAALAVLATAPTLLERFSDLVGIRTPALAFLLLAITFLLVLSLHFSWELSRLEDRTRKLAEECALLREQQNDSRRADSATSTSGATSTSDHDQAIGGEGTAEMTGGMLEPSQPRTAGPQQPHLP
jgi:hypothetical protein